MDIDPSPNRTTNVRNAAIVVVLALVVWLLPGAGTGTNLLSSLFGIILVAGLSFFAYRMYMEQRGSLFLLEDNTRAMLYGAVALFTITLVGTSRLWNTGGFGGLIWFALIGVAGYALVRAYRTWRAI